MCPGCGAPRGESEWQETVEYGVDDTPRSGRAQPLAAAPVARPKPRRRVNVRGWMLLALLAAIGWWYFHPRQVQGEVALKTWERSLEVQAYRTVRESDWQLPSGGRQLRSYRAIRDYRQELDHYERRTRQVSDRVQVGTEEYSCGTIDRGNGYFEDRMCDRPVYETRYRSEEYQEPVYRKVPIWATKYDYEIERWVRDTVLKAAGEADERNDPDEAEWPAPRLGKDRREGERTELYRLEFRTPDGDVYQREVPLRLFDEYDVGEPVKLKVRRSGTVEILGPDGKPLS
jgi:hypothetical protein